MSRRILERYEAGHSFRSERRMRANETRTRRCKRDINVVGSGARHLGRNNNLTCRLQRPRS
jgi:hypothetical protein